MVVKIILILLLFGCIQCQNIETLDKQRVKQIDCNFLSCSPNNTTDIIIGNYVNLEVLILQNNNLENVVENLTNTHLKNLSFAHNNIEIIPEKYFDNLNKLLDLDLTDNKIKNLPEGLFQELKQLKYLYLRKNNIQNISEKVFEQNVQLIALHLSSNNINNLHHNTFKSLENLQQLYLQNNPLTHVSSELFVPLHNIEVLYLSNNSIKMLENTEFANNKKLEYLYVDHNEIGMIRAELLRDLKNLKLVNLGGNNISNVDSEAFANNPNLSRVYLHSNRLAHLDERLVVEQAEELWLQDNPWRCDCNLNNTVQAWQDRLGSQHEPDPTCALPTHLEGVTWTRLQQPNLTCSASSTHILGILVFNTITICVYLTIIV